MDWEDASLKLIAIMKKKTDEIRSDISSESIVDATKTDLQNAGFTHENLSFHDFPDGMQMEMLKALLENINQDHRKKIKTFVENIGDIIEDAWSMNGNSFLAQDEDHILFSFERMKIQVKKELALKILALNYVP